MWVLIDSRTDERVSTAGFPTEESAEKCIARVRRSAERTRVDIKDKVNFVVTKEI